MCNCNKKVKLGFKKTALYKAKEEKCKELVLPTYATNGSAGMDVRSIEEVILGPGDFKVVSTGIIPVIPEGYEIQIRPRSGLAAKKGITVLNAPGTIDQDYTGDIGVILINHSVNCFKVEVGDRIAQLVLAKVSQAEVVEVDKIEETERGAGRFGSTGVK